VRFCLVLNPRASLITFKAVTFVSPRVDVHGWPFASVDQFPGAEADPLYNSEHIKDLYFRADPNYSARYASPIIPVCIEIYCSRRFSVPVLWDKKNSTIVNNESSEIIRIFNTGFNDLLPPDKAMLDFYPENLQTEIDELNEWIYADINSKHFFASNRNSCSKRCCTDGVYRAGATRTQEVYERAVHDVFEALDKVEAILTEKDYLTGDQLTEADIRLFVTIVRDFDASRIFLNLTGCD